MTSIQLAFNGQQIQLVLTHELILSGRYKNQILMCYFTCPCFKLLLKNFVQWAKFLTLTFGFQNFWSCTNLGQKIRYLFLMFYCSCNSMWLHFLACVSLVGQAFLTDRCSTNLCLNDHCGICQNIHFLLGIDKYWVL